MANFKLFLLVLAIFVPQIQAQALKLIVEVENLGTIQGSQTTTQLTKRPYAQFRGIPYAKAPVNESRFLPAEPRGRLTEGDEIFKATSNGNSCIQPAGFSFYDAETHEASLEYAAGNTEPYEAYRAKHGDSKFVPPAGSEDCLVLNVFTPKVPDENNTVSLPVIVFIHGGAFSSGNADFYHGKKLMEHDVVLVSINYRLGLLGFFSLQTNEAPGNAAMYDMITALQWVQEHIHAFGGNPDLVTITGQSAGAASVSHLVLSEMSRTPKQLFHRAIAMSGSALNSWAVSADPLPPALRVAELAGCYDPSQDTEAEGPNLLTIGQCMKYVATESLVSALTEYQNEERMAGRLGVDVLSPVIQTTGPGTLFLSKHPVEILEAGEQLDIPMMMGATKHDGTFPTGVTYNRFLSCDYGCGDRQENGTFLEYELVPSLLQSMGVEDDTNAVYDTLAGIYLKDSRYSGNFDAMLPGLIDLHSAFFFKAGTYRNLQLHSLKNPQSYWYSFDFRGAYSLFLTFFPSQPPVPGGVAHGDDLLYIFHFFTYVNDYERNVSRNMQNYWVNFAYNGNPNEFPPQVIPIDLPVWPAYNEDTTEFLIIDDEFSVGDDYLKTWIDASLELFPPPNSTEPPYPLLLEVEGLGKLQGKETTTQNTKRPYAQFLGIPYAKAPVGESRFLPAEPTGRLTENDEDVFDATRLGMSCVQPDGFGFLTQETADRVLDYAAGNVSAYEEYEARGPKAGHVGSEDCLFMNVFTPKIPKAGDMEAKLLPVIVFIHGGAFSTGNPDLYTGKKLLEHDVVLVTFNYRLGVLGFFTLYTNEVPGNAAFYDMITALHWVQEHIRAFGGDPDLVTIAGQSSGSAAVSHLVLSEMSRTPKQLFHRAIAASGSAMNSWAVSEDPIPGALRIAELALCYDPVADVDESGQPDLPKVTSCMKDVNVDNLVSALTTYQHAERKAGRLGLDVVSPVIQKANPGMRFLSKHPTLILEAGEQLDIPMMMGATKHDGSFALGITYNRFLNCADCGALQHNSTFLRKELVSSLLHSMGVNDNTHAVYEGMSDKFFKDTLDNLDIEFEEMIPGLIDLHSVFFFKAGAYRNLDLHSKKHANSYWYSFDFKGQYSFFPIFFPSPPPPIPGGVSHADDLLYIFHFYTHTTEAEKLVSEHLVNYWVNFAYNGNPNQFPKSAAKPNHYKDLPRWPAFDSVNTEYLIIDSQFSVGNNYMGSWVDASLELIEPPEPEPASSTDRSSTIESTSTSPTTGEEASVTSAKSTTAEEASSTNHSTDGSSSVESTSVNPTTAEEASSTNHAIGLRAQAFLLICIPLVLLSRIMPIHYP